MCACVLCLFVGCFRLVVSFGVFVLALGHVRAVNDYVFGDCCRL